MRKKPQDTSRKIIIFSCVYPPEPVVSAQTSEQIACGLVSRGHAVTVVASFPGRPGGKIYPGFRRALYARQSHPDGYALVRCFSVPSAESAALSRLLENLIFGLTSAAFLAISPRPDVIYSNTWPIFATGLMALVARLRRVPYVVSIQDIYPESFAAQGRGSRSGPAFRFMRWIDRQVAQSAHHVIVISEAFAEVYARDRDVPRERISVIPNWVDDNVQFSSESAAAALRHRFSIPPGAFLAAYGGNIGIAAGTDSFVRAFRHTGPDIYGLIAGEGSQLIECQALAGAIALQRISFFTPWPADQTMPLYQAADLLVLPTRGAQSMASVPSKMIRYMLSGKPILATGLAGSDLARLIDETQCGWFIPPDDPAALAEKLAQIKTLSVAELQQRGEAGRRYALVHFTNQVCLPKIIESIEKAVE